MAARNLIVRVGIDASKFASGLSKMRKAFKSASQQMANESAAMSASQKVAKAQAGTTVNDRVGALIQSGGAKLITEADINNIAEARRQAQDLAAVMTKLEAKGAAVDGASGPDAEKYWNVKGMYEAVSDSIREYEDATKKAASSASAAVNASRKLSFGFQSLSARARSAGRAVSRTGHFVSQLVRYPFHLLKKGAGAIRDMGRSATTSQIGLSRMIRSVRNIGLLSIGLRIAGAAFGRLRSIVSDYISSNSQLEAQVNGLKAGLGQALAPAVGMVVNAFSRLLPYVLGVANAIGSLFTMLFGGVFTNAAAGANKMASGVGGAAKAQKELNRQLMGFDQINRLEGDKDSSSGGGGGGGGTAMTPIAAKTPAWMERFKTSFSDLFNSEEFKAANIGGKIGMSLQTGLDWLGGEAMRFDWNGVGQKLRANWDSFWSSGAVESFGRTIGIAFAGIGDMIIGFMGPSWGEMEQAWKQQGIKGIGIYVAGMTLAGAGKLVSGFFTRLVAPMFQGMADYFREHGHQSIAGFFQGLADKSKAIGENIKIHFVDPIVNWVKNLLGIHSPSTVFAGFAVNCVDGFTNKFSQLKNRITEKFTGISDAVKETVANIKSAFRFNWQLPHIKLPHLRVDWVEAGGLLSKFLGVSHIPNLSVQWFAKGGIMDGAQIFGGAGRKLFGGGEAGREAVLPLDRNTGWMDRIAEKVVQRIGTEGDVNVTIPIYLDGKLITTEVIRRLRSQARRDGQPAWG